MMSTGPEPSEPVDWHPRRTMLCRHVGPCNCLADAGRRYDLVKALAVADAERLGVSDVVLPDWARGIVEAADALLAELEKTEPKSCD